MMNTTWSSCFTATAVAVGAFLAGCGSSTPTSSGTSGSGQSCQTTFDCKSPLACIDNVCGGSTVTPGTDAGTTTKMDSGVTPVMDSGVKPGKDSGTAPPPAVDSGFAGASALGGRCTQTSDCATGLECIPSEDNFGGICDLASFGLQPTGTVCGGECKTATDCYELPVGNPYGRTCADILANQLSGTFTTCTGEAAGDPPTSNACFYYKTYCQPAAAVKVWTCTANNKCEYSGACTVAAVNDLGGCPSLTRTGGAVLNGDVCDLTTKKCGTGPAVAPPCTSAASCNGMAVADVPTETCNTTTDCACYVNSGCYIKCATSLDCEVGYSCSTTGITAGLCIVDPSCSSNADCAAADDSVVAVCSKTTGTCVIPCTNDHDCSPGSGATATLRDEGLEFNGQVCDTTTKVCTSVVGNCTTDAQCTGGSVNTFCVPQVITPASPAVISAITTN